MYCGTNFVAFRVRDSKRNPAHFDNVAGSIPETFEYIHKIYRCTHGVSQKYRGKGDREQSTRYTGCEGRFTAHVENRSQK
ncbi:hypothetical protein JG688_00004855 [Phytophthora aleatoria]|uniref:Uncharacterized protein n=1 Tax=Phytophthora aleatoria TaxID=2496075 RepID=A0A8J5M906_9STRA|nr:hypothetical protein JG688_00004855 [Phytophthora aleatoria]